MLPGSIPASTPRAARCTKKRASARPAIATGAAPSICPPSWPCATMPICALSITICSKRVKKNYRPWSPSCANSSTPSSACSSTTSPTTAPSSLRALRSLVSRRSHQPQKRKGSFAILPKKKLATQERIYQLAIQERIYPEFFLLWFACSHRHAAILRPLLHRRKLILPHPHSSVHFHHGLLGQFTTFGP